MHMIAGALLVEYGPQPLEVGLDPSRLLHEDLRVRLEVVTTAVELTSNIQSLQDRLQCLDFPAVRTTRPLECHRKWYPRVAHL
eukprot:9119845-Heterocapsa_arctica.AAC.1